MPVQQRVAAGVLTAGHARAILSLDTPEAMQRLADKIVNEDLSVRAAEAASKAPDAALNAGAASFDVLELRGAESLTPSPGVPARLAEMPAVDAGEAVAERSFVMSGHNINDAQMDLGRADVVATVDTAELWTVRNENPLPHSFHVHDTQFRIIDVDGAPPPARLAGWKDTIALEKDRVYRLLVRFDDYADPTTPYMYHCHLLWHEDQGMMGQFLVVEPGQQPAITRPEGGSDDHHDDH